MAGCQWVRLYNLNIRGNETGAAIKVRNGARNISIDTCNITQIAGGIGIGDDDPGSERPNTVVISNCVINDTGSENVYIINSDNVTVGPNNNIYRGGNPVYGSGQGDNIDTKIGNRNLIIQSNQLYQPSVRPGGGININCHSNGAIIRNNYIHSLAAGDIGIRLGQTWYAGGGGQTDLITQQLVYNNLIVDGTSSGHAIVIKADSDPGTASCSGIRIYNNTIIQPRVGIFWAWENGATPCANAILQNNIITLNADSNYALEFSGGVHLPTAVAKSDYNCFYSPASSPDIVRWKVASPECSLINWSEWQTNACGPAYGIHSIDSFPSLLSDFSPDDATDPVVNAGTDDPSLYFTQDLRGHTRPAGEWDIGAFEYTGSASNAPLAPPKNLRLTTD
jgi:hypothetical protein